MNLISIQSPILYKPVEKINFNYTGTIFLLSIQAGFYLPNKEELLDSFFNPTV